MSLSVAGQAVRLHHRLERRLERGAVRRPACSRSNAIAPSRIASSSGGSCGRSDDRQRQVRPVLDAEVRERREIEVDAVAGQDLEADRGDRVDVGAHVDLSRRRAARAPSSTACPWSRRRPSCATAVAAFAMPKSTTFTPPCFDTSTFALLTSRWTMLSGVPSVRGRLVRGVRGRRRSGTGCPRPTSIGTGRCAAARRRRASARDRRRRRTPSRSRSRRRSCRGPGSRRRSGDAIARREPRLVEEVLDRALVAREVRVHDLERDELLEPGLAARAREVDVGHAAGAESAARSPSGRSSRPAAEPFGGGDHDRRRSDPRRAACRPATADAASCRLSAPDAGGLRRRRAPTRCRGLPRDEPDDQHDKPTSAPRRRRRRRAASASPPVIGGDRDDELASGCEAAASRPRSRAGAGRADRRRLAAELELAGDAGGRRARRAPARDRAAALTAT